MTDITLQGLSTRQLALLGDAALQAGHPRMASSFYARLLQVLPASAQAHVRLGLTHRANSRTIRGLEILKIIETMSGDAVFVGEGLATWLKNAPFLADEKFMSLAAKNTEFAELGTQNWHWNLQIVLSAAQQVRLVPGDFVELGVYKGHTTHFIGEYVDFGAWDKHWWLYDTFEGVPKDQIDPGREHMTVADYGEVFTFEEVRDRFAPFGNVTVTKGRVPEILAEVCPEQIAFLHIDLNNAVAEVAALDALYDKVSPGGVIVLDDFCWASSHAQFKAEMAWFAARGLTVFPLPTGQGLFVKPQETAVSR